MFKKFLTLTVLTVTASAGLLAAGCASDSPRQPSALTGETRTLSQSDEVARNWANAKGVAWRVPGSGR